MSTEETNKVPVPTDRREPPTAQSPSPVSSADSASLPPSLTHPQITSPDPEIEVEKQPEKPKRIPVVATARGFYGNVERNKGDRFYIAKEEDLGTWMKRADKEESKAERGQFATAQKRLDPSDLKNTAPSKASSKK